LDESDLEVESKDRTWPFVGLPLLLALGLVILIVIGLASVWLVVRSQSDAELVARALEAEKTIAALETILGRAEGGARAYLLTGDPDHLNDHRRAADRMSPVLAELKAATSDNAVQQATLSTVGALITQKIDRMRAAIRLYEAGDRAEAAEIARGGQWRALTQQIDGYLDGMAAVEQRLLRLRTMDSRRTMGGLLAASLVGALLIVVVAVFSTVVVRRANSEREAAIGRLEKTNAGLEAAIIERTAEIRHTADVLQNTIASMADAVLVTDESGGILISNPAAERLFGQRLAIGAESGPTPYHSFRPDTTMPIPPEDSPIRRALAGKDVDNLEMSLRRVGETKGLHIVANGRPLRDPSGAPKGAVVVYRDVTDTIETERQLRQSQKLDAIGQLTGGVAHDFNNILTVITGTIDILARAVADDASLRAIARLIDQAAERGAELTSRLLAFSRRQPLQPRETDVNGLIIETVKLLRPSLGEQVEIESALQEDAWAAVIDPSELGTALINLAINARDAMPGGGKLTFESANILVDENLGRINDGLSAGSYVVIAVSDTGTGIPAALRDKVFEPFFTTKEVGKGTGLGLSMVYGFAKQSGGHVRIYSEEGNGTTVRLYLPRAGKTVGQAEPPESLASPPGGSETILVVEDDVLVRSYVVTQLRSLGYRTLEAIDAADALAVAESGAAIDLVFTDIVMPGGMNGRELADQLIRRAPTTRVLFTSGYAENAIIHHGRLDPGVNLLTKPYRKSDLARMVRAAIDDSKRRLPDRVA
jgi:signal transduction histidine kinase/CHASE3 domain sensor protein/ActR/RegA family two-component response regulator